MTLDHALTRVEAAAAAKRAATLAYVRALHQARRAGASHRTIGRAAGCTEVAVRRMLTRHPEA